MQFLISLGHMIRFINYNAFTSFHTAAILEPPNLSDRNRKKLFQSVLDGKDTVALLPPAAANQFAIRFLRL